MGEGVLHPQQTAPRLAEQEEVARVEPEGDADLLHLVDETGKVPQRHVVGLVAAEGAQLVVVDDLDALRGKVVAQHLEVLVGGAGTAVQEEQPHRGALAEGLRPHLEGARRRRDGDATHRHYRAPLDLLPRTEAVGFSQVASTLSGMATNPDRASYFPAIEKKYGQPMQYWFDQMAELSDRKYPEQVAFLKENHGFSQAHANALVMYCRGSKSSRRHDTLDDYLAQYDETKGATVRAILKAISSKYPSMEYVIAWNQPMLKLDGQYVFGVSVLTHHILLGPWGDGIIDKFRPRLEGYKVNKKTIQVPVDWKPDTKLLRDMAAARIAEFRG